MLLNQHIQSIFNLEETIQSTLISLPNGCRQIMYKIGQHEDSEEKKNHIFKKHIVSSLAYLTEELNEKI